MPDVLIRGMEMPTNVFDCPLNYFGICDLAQDETHCDCSQDSRPEWCPLVPLPEGHGRLIDADALIENHFSDEHRIALSPANKLWMRRIIKGEPTIIEAEGGTDDDG